MRLLTIAICLIFIAIILRDISNNTKECIPYRNDAQQFNQYGEEAN